MDLRWEILAGYAPLFVTGLWMTLQLTAVAMVAGLALGIVFGLISSSRDAPAARSPLARGLLHAARAVTLAYVTFFRGTPLFVQILLVHFALMPALIQPEHGLLLAGDAARAFRQEHGAFFSGCLALSLNAGAYISEIFRAGIQSIHQGQTQAAYSVGLSHLQALRFVVLPQAFRRMVPALVNEGVTLIKDSSLVSAIGLLGAISGDLGGLPGADPDPVGAGQAAGSAGPPARALADAGAGHQPRGWCAACNCRSRSRATCV
jgi:polar amino acid transport system permease protein